jgi:Spy/CpxP family protein refolding chaperone
MGCAKLTHYRGTRDGSFQKSLRAQDSRKTITLTDFTCAPGAGRGDKMFRVNIIGAIILVLATACSLAFPRIVAAQSTSAKSEAQAAPSPPQGQPLSDQDIQMLRQNLRSQRKQVIAANLKLTDAEAEKFWPVYDQYIAELVKLNGTKYELIKQYVQNNGVLTDAQADSAVTKWLDVDQGVSALRLKYVPMFRKVLSRQNTALFYQLDRRIQLMIDLQLMLALPLIEPTQ